MLKAFVEHIACEELFTPADKLLVAVSGGIDSVVLAHLLKKGGFQFSLAHCNFMLRQKDSGFDEEFCRQLARDLNVEIFVKRFDVKAHRKKYKQSVQMAARELRYLWFKELLTGKKIHYLLTAHHGNDVIETVFINFLRGTGIGGLKGIPEKSGQVVRPLLCFTKAEILVYATENKINFRLDKTNLEDKYERNFLRLNIMPALKKLHPNIEKTVLNNVQNFKEEAAMVQELLGQKLNKAVSEKNGYFYFDKQLLAREKYRRSLLHFALSPFGFNATQLSDIERNLSKGAVPGALFHSASHTLTIDRAKLVVRENGGRKLLEETFDSFRSFKNHPHIKIKKIDRFMVPGKSELILEPGKVIFPLTIRSKMKGDKFKPFGMKGFKLLSDFLKEQKLNNFEKENCKLLLNGNGEIIWIIGYRSDERYKVNPNNTRLIKLTAIE